MTPVHPEDDLALYALDALDGEERTAVEAHLASCPSCVALVEQHRTTLAALTADEAPPPAVWQRIAADIGATGVPTPLPVVPSAPAATAPPPPVPGAGPVPPGGDDEQPPAPIHLRPRSRGTTRWALIGAVAAAALVVGGVVGLSLGGTEDEPDDLAELAAAALDDPDASVATLATESGQPAARVVVEGTTGYVLVDDLPALPEGEEYQLWKLGGDVPVSLGVIGDGSTGVAAVGVPAGTSEMALSTEPAGGSPAPTGDIVATGAFA
jgi:anti-sigma-K factor RskA